MRNYLTHNGEVVVFTSKKSLEDYIVRLVRDFGGPVNIRWIEVRVACNYSPRDLITRAPNTAELQEIVNELVDQGALAYDESFAIFSPMPKMPTISNHEVSEYILRNYGKGIVRSKKVFP